VTAVRQIAVLKFGGTSVATPDHRAQAIARVRDARDGGFGPVAVVSAMGRLPDPYATDALLALGGGASATRNADLLASCGETIAAAVMASELCVLGIEAVALTGAQAGIVTDAKHGDATILRVDPHAVLDLLDRGVVPVIAGFQGATEDGVVTTLGRGGTDLSAIAIGHALDAARVDIYTDVSGAMTADPRRIESARTIDRASLDEMTELAAHGAKVMHQKAADFARRTNTPYAIKGLTSDVGTIVDDAYDHHRPVTGVTASGRVTWVRAIRGDIDNQEARMQLELEMFRRVAEAEISIDQVTINQAGVCFVVEGDRGGDVRRLLGDLNLAVRVREGCSKLSVVGAGMRYAPGVIRDIVTALSSVNVEIIHCTDSNITVSVLIPQEDASRAEQAVHDQFHLAEDEAG
jgi:aspartate kinase